MQYVIVRQRAGDRLFFGIEAAQAILLDLVEFGLLPVGGRQRQQVFPYRVAALLIELRIAADVFQVLFVRAAA